MPIKWILACAGGIALVSCVSALPPPLLGLPLILFFLSSLKYQRLKYSGALVIGLLWGFCYGWLGLQAMLPAHMEGQELRVVGQVAGLPVQSERYQRFTMDVREARLDGDEAILEDLNRISINWYNLAQPVKPGEVWQFKVKLKRPHGLANPGTFSYETWLFRHGINATGYVRKDPENRRLGTPMFGRWIDRFRFNAFRELDSRGCGEQRRPHIVAARSGAHLLRSGDHHARHDAPSRRDVSARVADRRGVPR